MENPDRFAPAELDGRARAELFEFLRIPSVSGDPRCRAEVDTAAAWVEAKIARAGGTAHRLERADALPVVVGDVSASAGRRDVPRILVYGHFDVQPPGPLDRWESPPFRPEVRGEWLYGRGAADDKGQLWILLEAVERLACEGTLPVDVRFLCDGEEEVGGTSVIRYLEHDRSAFAAGVIFDTAMLAGQVPVFNLATRGIAYFDLEVTTGERDLHSGVFGGAALNAAHALSRVVSALVDDDGLPAAQLCVGVQPPETAEAERWRELPDGLEMLAAEGGAPASATAGSEFYRRTWALPAVDVHSVRVGDDEGLKTIVPARAQASLSVRLAPGQNVAEVAAALDVVVHAALPRGARASLRLLASAEPAVVPASSQAVRLALDAFEAALGIRPRLGRSGGSLPVLGALTARGIPVIVTGFDLPEGNIHAANERLRVSHVSAGVAAAKALLVAFGSLGAEGY